MIKLFSGLVDVVIFSHRYGSTNTEVWVRPGRVELYTWGTTTTTINLTPEESTQLAEALNYAAKEARK